MSPKSAPRRSVSAMAVAMMVLSASAVSADMGRVANGADAEERYAAMDKAITWGSNGDRALQTGPVCNSVSESEMYCCGFGGVELCSARGMDYSGPDMPCEIRFVTSNDGTMTCEGLETKSGFVDDCEEGTVVPNEDPAIVAPAMAADTPAPSVNPRRHLRDGAA